MNYETMITRIKNGKKAKLPHWKNKYIFVITGWHDFDERDHLLKSHTGTPIYVKFIAVYDNGLIGPANLHNCDMFNKNWETF